MRGGWLNTARRVTKADSVPAERLTATSLPARSSTKRVARGWFRGTWVGHSRSVGRLSDQRRAQRVREATQAVRVARSAEQAEETAAGRGQGRPSGSIRTRAATITDLGSTQEATQVADPPGGMARRAPELPLVDTSTAGHDRDSRRTDDASAAGPGALVRVGGGASTGVPSASR